MTKKLLSLCIFILVLGEISAVYPQTIYSENLPSPKPKPQDTFSIGKEFGGGKVFWLDETGKHGLIAAKTDQSAKGIAWNPGEAVVTSAISDKIYSGQANSDKILGVLGTKIQSAAKLCADYTITENKVEFSDWYLPSRFELDLLYKQRLVVGGFNTTNGIYWSSTETANEPSTQAWEQEFKFGSQLEDDKDMPNQVRCIRKF